MARLRSRIFPLGRTSFSSGTSCRAYLKNTKFNGGTTDAQGRAKLKIEAGKTLDLGDIKVPASVLK